MPPILSEIPTSLTAFIWGAFTFLTFGSMFSVFCGIVGLTAGILSIYTNIRRNKRMSKWDAENKDIP